MARLARAWRVLPHERRLAAIAAIGLFFTLFLPWYQETVIATGTKSLLSASAELTGWGAFSFVEGAVLLIAIGVLTLLFQRAEGRAFHLPGGDGVVIMAAGLWTCLLIVWRMFDKQGSSLHGQYATTYGVEWGIFIALAVAAFLAYSGSRIRAAHRAEPPLPGEEDQAAPSRRGPSEPLSDPLAEPIGEPMITRRRSTVPRTDLSEPVADRPDEPAAKWSARPLVDEPPTERSTEPSVEDPPTEKFNKPLADDPTTERLPDRKSDRSRKPAPPPVPARRSTRALDPTLARVVPPATPAARAQEPDPDRPPGAAPPRRRRQS